MTSIKKKAFDRCVAIVLSLAMLLVFPIVSFADVFAGTADAANSTQAVQTDESAAAEGESAGTDQDQASESAASADSEEAAETDTDSSASGEDSTASEKDSSAANESSDASGNEGSEVSYPRQTFEDSVNGTKVNVVAPEGALPEGTTMVVKAVASSDIKDAVEKAATGDIAEMQAIDISFHKDGKEIEPKSEVTVQFSGMDMDGDSIEVFHMKDTTSAADKVGESKSTTNASVQTKDFSIYVITSTESGTPEETLSTSGSGSTSKVLKIGDTMRLQEKDPKDYRSGGTWSTTDSSVVSITADASNSQKITIEAKKMGAAVISYSYTSTEWDKSKKAYKVKSDDYYVTVKSDDNRYQVCFYILLPGKSTPADSSAQPAANYYPASGSQYYTLTGTVSETVYNYIKDGNSYYDADGIDTSLYKMDDTTSTNIASYLTNTYGEKHDKGIVWYTLKQESDRCPHIDGFVSNADTTVTYHSNFGTDVTKKYDAVTGTKYTVLDYTAVGETAAEKLPTRSGFTFAGWSTTKGSTKVDYNADDTFQVKNATDLYAVWTSSSTYTATYKFVAQDGSALPSGVTNQCPSIETGYADGAIVTVPDKTYTPVAAVEGGLTTGTWSFVSWDQTSQKINGANVTFTGTWKFTPATKYGVTYEYKSADGTSLPADISTTTGDYKVKDDTTYYAGATVNRVATPKDGATYVVKDDNVTTGTWTLKWDKSSDTMASNGVKFVGTWTYTAAEQYTPTYTFESGTPNMKLPDAIKSYLPNDNSKYYEGEYAKPAAPTAITYDVVDNGVTTGTWTFQSWDSDSKQVKDGKVAFTGTWSFTKADTYIAEYKFEAAPDAALKGLPKGVTDQCPATKTDLTNGTTITPAAGFTPVDQTDTNGNKIGTWTFKEWSPSTDTVDKTNLSFTGYWSYKAVTPFHVTYEFRASDDSTLPYGVMNQLPTDNNDYYVNNKVTAQTGFNNVPVLDKDGYIDGYWTFVSWDKADATFTDSDITFTGTWQYEKTNIEYGVMYKDINDPTGSAISSEEYGAGNNGDVVDYDYLNGKGQIKAITNYEYVKVQSVTLHGEMIVMAARMASAFAADEYAEIPTAIVYYKKVVTPPPASDKYTLTINYVDEQGNTLADSYSDSLGSGTTYSQASPVISGYTLKDSAQETVAGTMPNENVTVTVVYKKTAVTPNDPKEPTTPTTPGTVKPASDKSSDTGDSWNGGLWMILMLLGTAGVITPIALRRKDSEED